MKNSIPVVQAAFLTIACMLLTQVRAADTNTPEEKIHVVTGNTIVQDMVTIIGGERVSATCLLQPGVDPHSYQPVPKDVKRLAQAKLVIINGLGFEGWFDGVAKEAGFVGTVVIATKGIEPLTMEEACDHGDQDKKEVPANDHAPDHEHKHEHHEVHDPHAFNSIAQGPRYAENIREALIGADPAGAEGYRVRAAAYIVELRKADAEAKKAFAVLPRSQRKLITNHDALQYFAKEYGFEILAPNTALEDSEPSAKDIAALVTFIRQTHVKGVFLEFGKNEKVMRQISVEAQVAIGQELYLDGVGPSETPAGTYIGMFRSNVASILAALK